MARGGVETPASTGRPYIPVEEAIAASQGNAEQDILDSDMGLPAIPMNDGRGIDLSTTTTGEPPVIPQAAVPGVDPGVPVVPPEQQQQGGGGPRVGLKAPQLNENYRYTQRDMYPDNPRIAATSPMGREMYMPSYGEVPLAILASQLQQTQKKRAAIQEKRDAFRIDEGLKETAPQFQQEFNKYATSSLAQFQKSIEDLHDGNTTKAKDFLLSPEGDRLWRRKVSELNAIGTEVKYVADQAADYIEQTSKGLEQADPETLKYAERVVAGYGTLGTDREVDLNRLINDSRVLKRTMNRTLFIKDRFVPGVEGHMQTLQQQGKAKFINGVWVLPTTELRSFKSAIEPYAREMTEMGMFNHVDEARSFLEQAFPTDEETTVQLRDPDTGGSGGSGSGNTGKGTDVRVDFRPLMTKSADGTSNAAGERTLLFTPFQTTGGKQHTVKEIVVSGGVDSPDIPMRDAVLVYRPAKKDWIIMGQSLTEQGKKELQMIGGGSGGYAAPGSEGYEAEQKEVERIWSTYRQPKQVPASSNSSIVETYWGAADPLVATANVVGVTPEEMRRLVATEAGRAQLAQKMGLPVAGAAAKPKPASTADPLGILN